MEGKINVAELLKDCPRGMELDCMMYENLYFNSLNVNYYDYNINCYTLINGFKTSINFTKYGTFNNHAGAKCVIYPKGKTTWEGFVPPCKFMDGDIIYTRTCRFIFYSIFKENRNGNIATYVDCCANLDNKLYIHLDDNDLLCFKDNIIYQRLATDKEKQILFDVIKKNGYKWNEKTKTLEKLVEPRFKVGDRVMKKCGASVPILISRVGNYYYFSYSDTKNCVGVFPIAEQDDWVLYFPYPKTYEECCTVLRFHYDHYLTYDDEKDINPTKEEEEFIDLMDAFSSLIVCRNAYWKIAGEQMGLGKPWEPDWDEETDKFTISNKCNKIYLNNTAWYAEVLSFPTAEMRDAFYENFKNEIEQCKELL